MVFDMTARGDSQNHADYARRMFGWELAAGDPEAHVDCDALLRRRPPPRRLPARFRRTAAGGSRGTTWISTPGTTGRRHWPGG